MAGTATGLGKSRRPKARDVVSRKGFLRRWAKRFLRGVLGWAVGGRLRLIVGGPVFFQTVRTACDLDLFGLLRRKPGLTLEQIAQELHIEENPARILLLTCAALKLVRKVGPRYRCRIVGRLLDRNASQNLVPTLEFVHQIMYLSMFHYAEAVRENRAAGLQVFQGDEDNLYQRLAHDAHLQKVFFEGTVSRDRAVEREFLDRMGFSWFRRILDVGGGDGTNLLAIANRHPQVQGTVFDLPSVVEQAARHIAAQGMDDRLKTLSGNVLEDELPRGHDCILFCRFLPAFASATNRSVMKKAYAAVEPGGMVCIYGAFTNDRETGPLDVAILSPYVLCTATGKGRYFSWQEASSWLREAGFVDITRVPLIHSAGVLLAFKR